MLSTSPKLARHAASQGLAPRRRAGDLHGLIVPARERHTSARRIRQSDDFWFERHGAVREAERGIQRGTPAWLAPSEGEPALHRIGLVRVSRRVVRVRGDGAVEHPASDRRVRFGRESVQFPALKIQVVRVQVGRRTAPQPPQALPPDLSIHLGGDAVGQILLHGEQVFERPVKTFRPQIDIAARVS